jgi:hypothetical protein
MIFTFYNYRSRHQLLLPIGAEGGERMGEDGEERDSIYPHTPPSYLINSARPFFAFCRGYF